MRIGIITIFHVPNNGALLQCYALSKCLKEMGHEVFLYDIPFHKSAKLIHALKERLFLTDMTKFISSYLPPYTSDLSVTADVYMVGSDQVWNPAIVRDKMGKFMLSFAPKGSRKVSYAASFGICQWKYEEYFEEAKSLLKEFSYITVRELSGVDILKKQFGLQAHHVLDPCFLLNDYTEIIGRNDCSLLPSDSLVVYKLIYSYKWYLQAKSIADHLKCNLVELSGRFLKKKSDMHGFNVKSSGVSHWLSAIANAKYVITDSFHGCVFSLIFRKQFVVVPGLKERSTRLTSLLYDLGLSNRQIENYSECARILKEPIDYKIVSSKIENLRTISYSHLVSMLQN